MKNSVKRNDCRYVPNDFFCNNTNKTQIPKVICYLTNRLDISEEKAIHIL